MSEPADGKSPEALPCLEARREGVEPVRFELRPGKSSVIGRSADADWAVSGDPHLSRRHVEISVEGKGVRVRRLSAAKNPVFYRGEEKDEFSLAPGEQFVIGETRFFLLQETASAPAAAEEASDAVPDVQYAPTDSELYSMGRGSERMRLHDLLELPDILRTKEPNEFFLHIATVLRMSTSARWAVILREDGSIVARDSAQDRQAEIKASRSLLKEALKKSPRPLLYCWKQPASDLQATALEGVDWAVCAAVEIPGDKPLFLYVAGEGGSAGDQRENSRFVGLVADMVYRSLSVKRLQTTQARLERFFSGPITKKILESKDPKELEPKVTESTVLFFDIRGFSKRTEGKNEKILSYLGELRRAMSAMTEEIFREKGVVLQYMGDGILACWNVPFPDPQHVDCACRAALRMSARLGEVTDGWRCGIGLHTGEVVGGAIGSDQMFFFGLMGAVVNQASRIEGITKAIEAPILVTREVAEKVSPEAAAAQRVGRFQPAGMRVSLDLYELSPPPKDKKRAEIFNRGLEAFEKGEWEEAYEILDELPSKDLPARYLKSLAESYRRRPPKGWQGVIELADK